jgi:hypothetical protein
MPFSHTAGVDRRWAPLFFLAIAFFGCDREPGSPTAPEVAATPVATTAAPLPEPPRAPDILVDASRISVGNNQVAAVGPGLADKIGVFLTGRPLIEGQTVNLVAMRNAKPSTVTATVSALERARATGASVHTEARDGTTTEKLALSFAKTVPDCAPVAWIAKDSAIDVWPAGGGKAKRITHGLAGPDITLGTEAVRKQAEGCNASELVVGSDDGLTWGLVFDLATSVLGSPGARASAAVLVTNAAAGRKIIRD